MGSSPDLHPWACGFCGNVQAFATRTYPPGHDRSDVPERRCEACMNDLSPGDWKRVNT